MRALFLLIPTVSGIMPLTAATAGEAADRQYREFHREDG